MSKEGESYQPLRHSLAETVIGQIDSAIDLLAQNPGSFRTFAIAYGIARELIQRTLRTKIDEITNEQVLELYQKNLRWHSFILDRQSWSTALKKHPTRTVAALTIIGGFKGYYDYLGLDNEKKPRTFLGFLDSKIKKRNPYHFYLLRHSSKP